MITLRRECFLETRIVLPLRSWTTSVSRPTRAGPVLRQSGPDFSFTLRQEGGDRRVQRSEWGPDLAHVMGWYWDEKTREEVCHVRNGKECMRFNKETGGYRYPDLVSIPTDGEQFLFGELSAASGSFSGPVPSEARLGNINVRERIPRCREGTTNSGF